MVDVNLLHTLREDVCVRWEKNYQGYLLFIDGIKLSEICSNVLS